MSIYEYAKKYREIGWNVIPLYHYSKNPFPLKWKDYQDRMSTDQEFEDWFNNPEVTGLGLITGKLSGIVVLDEDTYKEGGIPVSVKTGMLAQTARGGKHHYFRYVEPIKSSGFRKGINVEIKADGGFVVLPPTSVVLDGVEGQYEWIDKCMPEELMPIREEMLTPYRGASLGEHVDIVDLEHATIGNQHNSLRSIALAILNRFKQSEWDLAEAAIRTAASEFDPPHPVERVEKMIRDCENFVRNHPREEVEAEISGEAALPSTINQLVEERIEDRKLEENAPKTGWPELDRIIKGFIPGHIYTLTGDTNVGKCEKIDTPHLMFDGSIKMVQDLRVGDMLMGPDNGPRRVLSTTTGEDEMFLIRQQWGIDYTVNRDHILSLKCSTIARKEKYYKEYEAGKVINIPLSEYLKKSGNFKKFTRGWHVGVDFPKKSVNIDPYFLGIWLGDGHTKDVSISTIDPEIVVYLRSYADQLGMNAAVRQDRMCLNVRITTGKKGNYQNIDSLQKRLRSLGVLGKKHIPDSYRINARDTRLQLLAGLIDSDGWVQKNVGKNGKECFSYAISLVNKRLSDDILLLACSLGFNARQNHKIAKMKRTDGTVYKTDCYMISIQGHLSEIPVRVSRKKITSIRTKAVGYSSFKVVPQGRGQYFGFTLDGDGLYLLADGTVTHNTTIACNFAEALRKQEKRTLYIALEPDINLVEYLASVRLRKRFRDVTNEDLALEEDDGLIKIFLQRDVKTLEDLIRSIKSIKERFDLIIIDHIGYFVRTENNWVQQQSNVIKELAFLAKENKTAVMMIAHLRKPGSQKKREDWVPTQNDISGSGAFKQDSTEVIIAYRPTKPTDQFAIEFSQEGFLLVTKTKTGPNGSVPILFQRDGAKIWSEEEATETIDGRIFLAEKDRGKIDVAMRESEVWMKRGVDKNDGE